MAKNNNLMDFLTDVADAIRTKKGTTAKINPQDFSSEINNLTLLKSQTKSDVNFYDYDGTLLHSYTKAEFLALSALPALPTQEGLTCQGWNYTLSNAKTYVTTYGVLDIGATYITDDGKTRLYIRIAAKGRMTVPLYFSQTVANSVTIDWGDGSGTQTVSGTGYVNTSHTYSDIGDYVITLNVSSGTLGLGNNSASYCVMGSTSNQGKVYCNMLQRVEIGSSVTSINNYAFLYCTSLTSVVIPNGVTSIYSGVFSACFSLASVVIPNSVTIIGGSAFSTCYSLASVVIPNGVTSIRTDTFRYCYSLASVVIPNSVTSISSYAFCYCYSLASVVIPNSVTSISSYAFQNCCSLASVVIPNSVTSIDDYAFCYCYGVRYYDFRTATSIPQLLGADAFLNIPSDCEIVVPDSLYESWIEETNWSEYYYNIIKANWI